ncbi:MAG TPA: hypothetical protein VK077_01370 [Virgibacillus sp.]|nr:hypothetical protein [Virgibacillus sp.]
MLIKTESTTFILWMVYSYCCFINYSYYRRYARGIGFIGIVLVVSVFQLYGVAMIAGLAWAGNVALSSAILSDLYGVKLVGILYGLAFFVHQIGATISTLLGGWAYETFGTHTIAFGGAGIILLLDLHH